MEKVPNCSAGNSLTKGLTSVSRVMPAIGIAPAVRRRGRCLRSSPPPAVRQLAGPPACRACAPADNRRDPPASCR
eukprot:2183529-Pyramimonas_sp.AAC.1